MLLDVRTPAEWEVSHLPGARWVDPEAIANDAAGKLAKERRSSTYCSVGYRSGEMAQRLRAAGYTRCKISKAQFSSGRTKAVPSCATESV